MTPLKIVLLSLWRWQGVGRARWPPTRSVCRRQATYPFARLPAIGPRRHPPGSSRPPGIGFVRSAADTPAGPTSPWQAAVPPARRAVGESGLTFGTPGGMRTSRKIEKGSLRSEIHGDASVTRVRPAGLHKPFGSLDESGFAAYNWLHFLEDQRRRREVGDG